MTIIITPPLWVVWTFGITLYLFLVVFSVLFLMFFFMLVVTFVKDDKVKELKR